MSRRAYTEAEVLEVVTDLTPGRLTTWVSHQLVRPVLSEAGPKFREVDVARLQTLVDLEDSFDLGPDALGMVMSLMDRMHLMHADLESLMAALAAEPAEVRSRIRSFIATRRPIAEEPRKG